MCSCSVARIGGQTMITTWQHSRSGFRQKYFAHVVGVLVAALVLAGAAQTSWATFHLMQIEQVIGGVNGDTTAQAVQLRMRSFGQNLVSGARLVAYDAAGANPVVVIDFSSDVTHGSTGDRVLITSANFAPYTSGTLVSDFTMTNPIPASYLAAGRLTYERDTGGILWSVSWGGTNYNSATTGTIDNDADGQFGPSVDGDLPSSDLRALKFQGAATALSSNNQADYALTAAPSAWINNAGQSFT